MSCNYVKFHSEREQANYPTIFGNTRPHFTQLCNIAFDKGIIFSMFTWVQFIITLQVCCAILRHLYMFPCVASIIGVMI